MHCLKLWNGSEALRKNNWKGKGGKTHYPSLTNFRADSFYYVQNKKKKAWERCLLSSDDFFLNLYTVFCTDCTDKGGGEGGGDGS